MSEDKINKAFDEEYIKYREAFPKEYKASDFLVTSGFVDSKLNPIKREWVGLTTEEIDAIWGTWMRPYAAMVEAKLKEKNA
jgi:hypothetical protein